MMSDLQIIRTKIGWAVQQDSKYRLAECTTLKEAQARLREIAKSQQEMANWLPDLLQRRGMESVTHADLEPGDEYTTQPYGPAFLATRVDRTSDRATMVWYDGEFTHVPDSVGDLHLLTCPVYRKIKENSMGRFASVQDLAAKIDHEGGILESVEYGISAEEMPADKTELTAAWSDLEKKYQAARRAAAIVQSLIDDEPTYV